LEQSNLGEPDDENPCGDLEREEGDEEGLAAVQVESDEDGVDDDDQVEKETEQKVLSQPGNKMAEICFSKVVRDDGAMYNLMSKCKISKDKMSKKND
jgi:hypothetical protein